MKYMVTTKAEARKIRRALRQDAGYPARGVTVGPVAWEPPEACELDANGDPIPTPGWTTEAIGEGEDDGTATVALAVPPELERKAGKKVKGVDLPALTDEADLPQGVKDKREGKDPKGDKNPNPPKVKGK